MLGGDLTAPIPEGTGISGFTETYSLLSLR